MDNKEIKLIAFVILLVALLLIFYVVAFVGWISHINTKERKLLDAKNTFLRDIISKLKNPISGIVGVSEMLDQGSFGEVNLRQRETLRNIKKSGESTLEILNEFLEATTKNNIFYNDERSFNFETLLSDVADKLQQSIKTKNINMVVHLTMEDIRLRRLENEMHNVK